MDQEQQVQETPVSPVGRRATRSPWERPEDPPSINLTERDCRTLQFVWENRYATLAHVAARFGQFDPDPIRLSWTYVARRLRQLFRARYLERPSFRSLTGELVYALSQRGRDALNDYLRVKGSTEFIKGDFSKTGGWGPVMHEVEVTTLATALRLSLTELVKRGKFSHFNWISYPDRKERILRYIEPNKAGEPVEFRIHPDVCFQVFGRQDEDPIHIFGEIDREARSAETIGVRYLRYWKFWRLNRSRGFNAMRLVTITETKSRREALRRVAARIGRTERHPGSWSHFRFTNLERIDLGNPLSVLGEIYLRAEGEKPSTLF